MNVTIWMNSWLSNLVPFTAAAIFFILVLLSAELLDRHRKKSVSDRPSSTPEPDEKKNDYIMLMDLRIKPKVTDTGNPDYTVPIPESQEHDDKPKSSEYRIYNP